MKKRAVWLVASALLVASVGGAAIAVAGTASTPVTVKKAYNATLQATILVNGRGLTLYVNTKERKGRINCIASCRSFWPPLLVPTGVKPTAGTGVKKAWLGTLKRPDGGTQVTYKGIPLYRFKSDRKPGDATGQKVKDLGGVWSAATVSGSTTPAPAPPPPPTTTTTTTTSTGYGY